LQDDAGPSPRRRRLFQRDQELSGLGASLLAAGLVLVVLVVVVGIRLIHGIGGDRTSNAASTTPPAAPSPAPPGGLPQPGAVRTPTTADAGGGATVSFDFEHGLNGWQGRGVVLGEIRPGYASPTALELQPTPEAPPDLGSAPAGARLALAPPVIGSARQGTRVQATAWVAAPKPGARAVLRLEESVQGQTVAATSALLDLRDATWHEFAVVHEVSEEHSTILLLVGGLGLERSEGLRFDAVRVTGR